jgi:signal transduction histidine kinase
LDHFVPEGVTSAKEVQSWRFMAGMAFAAAIAQFAYSLQSIRVGANLGTYVIAGSGLLLFVAPWVGLRTGNKPFVFYFAITAMLLMLCTLGLGQSSFSLFSTVWFALMPVAALVMLGLRGMWITLAMAIVAGASCYALSRLGVHLEGFAISASMQEQLDFVMWLLFVVMTTAMARIFFHTQERSEQERLAMEEQLEKGRRMQAVGELAGGVAHEFNNVLAVVIGTAQALQQDALSAEQQDALTDIEHAAKHGGEIAQELLLFSQGKSDGKETMHVSTNPITAVDNSVRLLSPVLGANITLKLDSPEETLADVAVSARHIEQTVLNLAINARDAMPDGGELRITMEQVDLSKRQAQALGLASGAWVSLSVVDTGDGMAPETLERIFDPFYTTKSEGNGLGLSVVFRLIQAAGGTIVATSKIGVGTSFKIYMPFAASVSATPSVPMAKDEEEGLANVLVVDDQAAVRKMVRRVLERAGHAVTEAEDGDVALELLTSGHGFNLIVSDVRMPRVGGVQMMQRLRESGIQIPVVFMTGYAGTEDEEHLLHELGVCVLRKPFSAAEFVNICAALL